MKINGLLHGLAAVALTQTACLHYEDTLPFEREAWANEMPAEQYYDIYSSGKRKNAVPLEEVFVEASLDTLPFPIINEQIAEALKSQLEVFKHRPLKGKFHKGQAAFSQKDLEEVIEILLEYRSNPVQAKERLKAYQVWGGDQKGHVKFTGYYTPSLKVSSVPDSIYHHPFYRKPASWEGPLPTRRQIDAEGALDSLGLEIAYAADPVDVYYTHLQGSGMVEFADTGEKRLLVYEGSNKQPYRSIEQFLKRESGMGVEDVSIFGIKRLVRNRPEMRDSVLLVNPSYSFFRLEKKNITGAGQVPLMEDISVAVDKRYFPLGCTLLAAVPVFNKKGEVTHHEFRILLAQDVGGAIRGPGHMDMYSGTGVEGQRKAGKRMHYGMVWLLLPAK
ncbi:MAG: MltA domain-containing protein [Saprospiraceae bacterium]